MATITETRDVHGFTEVIAQGYGDVTIEQGETEGVVVEADEVIMSRIRTEVRDGRLILGFRMEWWEWLTWWWTWLSMPNKAIRYRVNLRDFSGAVVSGSGNVTAGSLRGAECRVRISGSGKVQLGRLQCRSLSTHISGSGTVIVAGTAERHDVAISGSGSVRATDFETDAADVRISGSGNAAVNVRKTLNIQISGSGSIYYRGQPQISQQISGSGRISAER